MRDLLKKVGFASIGIGLSALAGCSSIGDSEVSNLQNQHITYSPLVKVIESKIKKGLDRAVEKKDAISIKDYGENYLQIGKVDKAVEIVGILYDLDMSTFANSLSSDIQRYIDNQKIKNNVEKP